MGRALVSYAVARLSEPSTWAAIGVAVVGAFPEIQPWLSGHAPYIIAIATGLGIALPEKKG